MADTGRQVSYGMGKETTPGTGVAATRWINQLSFNLRPRVTSITNNSAWGRLERTNSATVAREWSEGEMEAKLGADSAGDILLATFGSVSTADNADSDASVKDHTFNLTQNVNGQPYTFHRKDSLTQKRYPGGRITEWSLQMELDQYIRFTANIIAGKGETTTGSVAYVDESLKEFVAKHFTVKNASNLAGLDGASNISTVQSFTLTVNPNVEIDWQAGTDSPEGIRSRGYDLGFEMTCRYNDTTFEEAYRNGTNLAMQLTAKNTDTTIGSAANPGLVLTAGKMNITDWDRSEELDGPVEQTMTGTIHFSAADAFALRAVLTNTVASY